MNIEELRDYCITKDFTEEGLPFGPTVLVFKVMGKMFALVGLDNDPLSVNLKCDPENAIALREEYACVLPGYHMSKTNWNTVILDGSVSDKLVMQWIDDSYNLVLAGVPKSVKAKFAK